MIANELWGWRVQGGAGVQVWACVDKLAPGETNQQPIKDKWKKEINKYEDKIMTYIGIKNTINNQNMVQQFSC